MKNLYNELISGSTEFRDGGEIITKPPTSLALRAARAINQLSEVNASNQQFMQQVQQANHELMTSLTKTQESLKELQDAELQRVRDGGKQAGPLDSGSGDVRGSSEVSAQRDLFENDSISTN